MPTVELQVRKTFQFINKKFALQCLVTSNPIERIFWSKDEIIITNDHNKRRFSKSSDFEIIDNSHFYDQSHINVEKIDLSSLNDNFKIQTILTVNVRLFVKYSKINFVTLIQFDHKECQKRGFW